MNVIVIIAVLVACVLESGVVEGAGSGRRRWGPLIFTIESIRLEVYKAFGVAQLLVGHGDGPSISYGCDHTKSGFAQHVPFSHGHVWCIPANTASSCDSVPCAGI